MANPARRARPAHPLIGDLIQAHRQTLDRRLPAERPVDPQPLPRLAHRPRRRARRRHHDRPQRLPRPPPRRPASPPRRWSRTTSSSPTCTAGCTPNAELPGRDPMARVARPKGADRVDPARIGYVTELDYHRLLASFDMRLTLDCRNAAICSLMYLVRGAPLRGRPHRPRPGRHRPGPPRGDRQERRVGHRRPARGDRHADPPLPAPPRPRPSPGPVRSAPSPPRPTTAGCAPTPSRRCSSGAAPSSASTSPAHQFRRAMAIHAKARGINDTTVQHIGRWNDPRMVQPATSGPPRPSCPMRSTGPTTRRRVGSASPGCAPSRG